MVMRILTENFKKTLRVSVMVLLISAFYIVPTLLFAITPAKYYALEGIPGLPTGSGDLPKYLNSIYKILITVGAMIACIRIIIAGFKWSMSGIVTDKSEAKHEIKGSLFGLAILLIPFIVLTTINPELVSLNILRSSEDVKMDLIVAPTPSAPNQNTVPQGMTVTECNYEPTFATSTATDASGAPRVEATWDSSACQASCSQKNGTFSSLGNASGQCTYKAAS
jgi:hypothetical protein